MTDNELCKVAIDAMKNSYAPYSNYTVGAALLTGSGKIYTGCNIENAAYSPSVCAERVAFFNAISSGEKDFVSIAVAGGKNGNVVGSFPPCGVCRQVMAEFCAQEFNVFIVTGSDTYKKYSLFELLPEAFTPKNISE